MPPAALSSDDLASMGVRALKQYIDDCGGDHTECLEKSDLRAEALRCSNKVKATTTTPTKPRRTRVASSVASVPSSPGSPAITPGTGNSASGRKKMSVFRAKKFVASKVGDTKMGRATVVKILGEAGDVMLQALKSATSTLDSHEEAKRKKHDIIKFMLKGYNLWKHKDITEESTRNCRRPTQIAAERLVMLAETKNVATRDFTVLLKELVIMKEEVLKVFQAHVQDKNYAKLNSLLSYYTSESFVTRLVGSDAVRGERDELISAIKDMLAPTESILMTERSKDEINKLQRYVEGTLKSPHLVSFIEQPQLATMLQDFLDAHSKAAPKDSVRFLLAVQDYEKTTSKNLLKVRAPKIFDKYLRQKASNPMWSGCDEADVERVDESIAEGRVGMALFNKLKKQIISLMEDDFQNFLKSKDFVRHSEEKAKELAGMLEGRM